MSREDLIDEPHEGEWFYVSAPFSHVNGGAQALSEQVSKVIRQKGWTVLAVDDERAPERRIAAVRAADACIFDVSCASATIAAEIATAVSRGRPVIALEHEAAPAPDVITALVNQGEATRVIRYGEVDECVAALGEALVDPAWLEAVGRAAVHAD